MNTNTSGQPQNASFANPLTFDIGSVQAEVWPSGDGRLARFLLFRTEPGKYVRVLVESGSEQNTASCLRKANQAARRLDRAPG